MTEIIIAIILQLTTTLGGVPAEKETGKKDTEKSKEKVESPHNPLTGSGGSGNWEDGGK